MKIFLQQTKPLAVALLALFAAIAVTLGAVQLRVWWSGNTSADNNSVAATPSDAEKLRILASLAATSTPSQENKSKTLRALSTPAEDTPTEEEKLKVLQSLQAKP